MLFATAEQQRYFSHNSLHRTDMNIDIEAIAKELDNVHAKARSAYLKRDLNAYRAVFTEDLRYLQPNGKPIGLQQLMRDVGKQLAQFKSVDSEFTRESIAMNQDGSVTQFGSLNGTYSVSIFFFFTKTWKIVRRGRYTFRKIDDEWRICEVEVLSETVKSQSSK
jgi:ketosteroid isomerase-like protein